MVECGVDVFYQRDTFLRKVHDEFLKRVIVETGAREGDDVDVEPEASYEGGWDPQSWLKDPTPWLC